MPAGLLSSAEPQSDFSPETDDDFESDIDNTDQKKLK
jgi:hypothetical protein